MHRGEIPHRYVEHLGFEETNVFLNSLRCFIFYLKLVIFTSFSFTFTFDSDRLLLFTFCFTSDFWFFLFFNLVTFNLFTSEPLNLIHFSKNEFTINHFS